MKVSGLLARRFDKELVVNSGLTVPSTKEPSNKTKQLAKDDLFMQMAMSTRVSGLKIELMGSVFTLA